MSNIVDGKSILIVGGTGSLGTQLTKRLLSGTEGTPRSITIFSRDETKQYEMNRQFNSPLLKFILGDVRNPLSVLRGLQYSDIVIHAAAMKHVLSCEENAIEAVDTNINGSKNIVQVIESQRLKVESVLYISSDKGVHPANTYGMTKGLGERVLLRDGNKFCPQTRFIAVCYGNVMASRGSVIPLFQEKVSQGLPLEVHNPDMTRFLISLNQAVDTLFAALRYAKPGEIFVPRLAACRIGDLAEVMAEGHGVQVKVTQPSWGEKQHECLIAEEEVCRTLLQNGYYVVTKERQENPSIDREYVSKDYVISKDELRKLLDRNGLLVPRKEVPVGHRRTDNVWGRLTSDE